MSGPRLFSPTGAEAISPGGKPAEETLFGRVEAVPPVPGDGPAVDTPLGRVVFTVYVAGEAVAPSAAWRCGPYTVWRFGESVECLLNSRFTAELPPGRHVDGAAAVLWRQHADEARVECSFADDALFADDASFTDGSQDTDENLHTRTFFGGDDVLAVGARWPDDTPVWPSGDGVLPGWLPSAPEQMAVVCAWTSNGPDDPSPWQAVALGTRSPQNLLAFE